MLKFVKYLFGKAAKTQPVLKVTHGGVERTAHNKSLEVMNNEILQNESTVVLPPSALQKLSLIELSLRTRDALTIKLPTFDQQKKQAFWLTVEKQLMSRLEPTTDPDKIRSYSMILYNLAKSKFFTANFQTQFALMLPFASPKSLTSIAVSISRMGGLTPQFRFLLQKYYETAKDKLTPRERVSIGYVLVKNGGTMDTYLLEVMPQLNMKELITLMRITDMSNHITPQNLKKFGHHFSLRRKQINVFDLGLAMQLFFKHQYYPEKVQKAMLFAYNAIKKNINEHCFQQIWQYFPQMVNANLLNIEFVESIILTLKILYKKQVFSQEFIRKVRKDTESIENLEIRERCSLR